MGARTKSRKRAIDLLFEAENRGMNARDLLAEGTVGIVHLYHAVDLRLAHAAARVVYELAFVDLRGVAVEVVAP